MLQEQGDQRQAGCSRGKAQGGRLHTTVVSDSMFQTFSGMQRMLMLPARLLQACHALPWSPLHARLSQSKQVHAGKHEHSLKSCSSNVCVGVLRRSWSRRGETVARPPDARGYDLAIVACWMKSSCSLSSLLLRTQ